MAHWWCPVCKQAILPQNVTFEEYHDTCGSPVEWINGEGLTECEHLRHQVADLTTDRDELRRQVEELQKGEPEASSYRDSDNVPTEKAVLRREYLVLRQHNVTMSEFIRKMFCKSHCEFLKDGCFEKCVVNQALTASGDNRYGRIEVAAKEVVNRFKFYGQKPSDWTVQCNYGLGEDILRLKSALEEKQ